MTLWLLIWSLLVVVVVVVVGVDVAVVVHDVVRDVEALDVGVEDIVIVWVDVSVTLPVVD